MKGYKCCKCGNMTLGEHRILAPKLVIGDTRSNFSNLRGDEMGINEILCEDCFRYLKRTLTAQDGKEHERKAGNDLRRITK